MTRSFAGHELAPGLIVDATRVYFGADVPNDDFGHAESLLDHSITWQRRHDGGGWDSTTGVWPWASDARIAEMEASIAAGRVPVVVFAFTAQGPNGVPVKTSAGSGYTNTKIVNGKQGLDRFATGEWDAKTLASLQRLAALPSPVLLIFGQEPNIPAMGGFHGYQGGTAPYVAAFRHFATLKGQAAAKNVGLGWCPTLFVPGGDTHDTVFGTFPGADILTFGGMDAYRGQSSLAGTCDWLYDFIVGQKLPVVVCEWGTYPPDLDTDLGEAVAAMKSTRYEAIVGFMAWALLGISDNRFDASAGTLASWKKTVTDPFLGVTPEDAFASTGPQVGIIAFENASRSNVLSHPTFAAEAKKGVDHSHHEGTSKPSLPDYSALISGSYLFSQGHFGGSPIGKDGTFKVGQSTAPNLLTQLAGAGHAWKAYEEGVSGPNGYTAWGNAGTGGLHVARHCPASFFAATKAPGVNHGNGRYDFDELRRDITGKSLPDFFFVTPNAVNDGHNSGLGPADSWLAGKTAGFPGVTALLAAMRPGSVLILTFDNVPQVDTSAPITGTGVIYLVVLGPGVAASTDATATNHFGLLRAIQAKFGLPAFTAGVDSHYTGAKAVALP